MPYSTELVKKLNNDIDVASGNCRIRVKIIKLWEHYGDLEVAINKTNYKTINMELIEKVKQKYRELIKDE